MRLFFWIALHHPRHLVGSAARARGDHDFDRLEGSHATAGTAVSAQSERAALTEFHDSSSKEVRAF